MDRMIAELNIKHFMKLLETEQNEPKRQCILRLLADEKAKLRLIEQNEKSRSRRERLG